MTSLEDIEAQRLAVLANDRMGYLRAGGHASAEDVRLLIEKIDQLTSRESARMTDAEPCVCDTDFTCMARHDVARDSERCPVCRHWVWVEGGVLNDHTWVGSVCSGSGSRAT